MSDIRYPNLASEFVALSHYCRWLPGKNRRENWSEVIDRALEFLQAGALNASAVPADIWAGIRLGMETFSVMPSMRIAATAGPAAAENNISCYNCAYAPIDDLRSFSELMFVLLTGTGIGFSVERENVEKLPIVARPSAEAPKTWVVDDSREGWASAFRFGLETWFSGGSVEFDFSQVRPAGTRLKKMGGRASGPGPLRNMMQAVERIIRGAAGRRLTPLECHDICCFAGQAVVFGGSRRAAMISFSDPDDVDMRHAKDLPIPAQRFLANDSAVYRERPGSADFLREWTALALSRTGERGILNVSHLDRLSPCRSYTGRERTNPCGEIILRPYEMCNLSEAVVRPSDSIDSLTEKVKIAAWLGVLQSTFTSFPFLREEWRRNCEEERLIGVSLTGQLDNPGILTEENLERLRAKVIETATDAAHRLGINTPAAFTCTKPSGTVSQVVNCAAGCHPRWSRYYIRRFRISRTDPLFMMLQNQGMPFKPEVGQTDSDFNTAVVEFPVQAPDGAITRDEWDAMRQLEWYRKVQKHWSTHNVSTTVYVRDDEWPKVGNYVYENWDDLVGLSFFPYEGARYELAPNEALTREQYERMVAQFPKLDFSKLWVYELLTGDTTLAGREYACLDDSEMCEAR